MTPTRPLPPRLLPAGDGTRRPRRPSPRALALAIAFGTSLASCLPSGSAPANLPPFLLVSPLPLDSARGIVLGALEQAELPVDGAPVAPHVHALSSTFVVRQGGMGEAEIRLMLRLRPDSPPDSAHPPATLLEVDATARERGRMLTMSPEDARSPALSRTPHAINENDRETLARIGRLVRILEERGFARRLAPGKGS